MTAVSAHEMKIRADKEASERRRKLGEKIFVTLICSDHREWRYRIYYEHLWVSLTSQDSHWPSNIQLVVRMPQSSHGVRHKMPKRLGATCLGQA